MNNNVVSSSHAPVYTAFDAIDHHTCWGRLIWFQHVEVDGNVVQHAAGKSYLAHIRRTVADLVMMEQYLSNNMLILLTGYQRPLLTNIVTQTQLNFDVQLNEIAFLNSKYCITMYIDYKRHINNNNTYNIQYQSSLNKALHTVLYQSSRRKSAYSSLIYTIRILYS